MSAGFLQSDTMPIVTGYESESRITVTKHFGTSFLVSDDGLAVSALHVLRSAKAYASENKQHVYVVGKPENGTGSGNVLSPIIYVHEGDTGSDLCVLETLYYASTKHRLFNNDVTIWQRVATLGYPEEATDFNNPKISIVLRGQKGIVQRVLLESEVGRIEGLKKFELSFAATVGMSGAPLYSYPGEDVLILGVILGTKESRQEIIKLTDFEDPKEKWRETTIKVNYYGIAASIDHIKNVKLSPIYGNRKLSVHLSEKYQKS